MDEGDEKKLTGGTQDAQKVYQATGPRAGGTHVGTLSPSLLQIGAILACELGW